MKEIKLKDADDMISIIKKDLKNNNALSEQQKKEVLGMLGNPDYARAKILEYLMEIKNTNMNSVQSSMWVEKLLAWNKSVYGDAPVRTENINVNVDMNDIIRQAYQKRMKEAEIIGGKENGENK